MEYCASVTGDNIEQYLNRYEVLVCSLRPSRIKAKQLAVVELFFVLARFGGIFIVNGPLGNVKGLVAFFVDRKARASLPDILKTVGYCDKYYLLDFSPQSASTLSDIAGANKQVWKGMPFSARLFYEQDREVYESHSSHRREFHIYTDDGLVKKVKGYRGDGTDTGKRALPVEDARLMVNLADPHQAKVLMDPFAGSGGILHAARYINPSLVLISSDCDLILEPGLQAYADRHYPMDARAVELDGAEIDALVTEVPFSANATNEVAQAFIHLSRFLKKNARVIFMCAGHQYNRLKQCLETMAFHCFIAKPVNRKGTDVVVSVWYRCGEQAKRLRDFRLQAGKIY